MTDTVAILNTIRATFADSEPGRFDIGVWFNTKTGCGCIIGQALTIQPLMEELIGVRLNAEVERSDGDMGIAALNGLRVDIHDFADEVAPAIGISPDEANHLFNYIAYSKEHQSGPAGHREALRRLDEVIARYTAKAATPVAEPVA